jgi:kumamolisin
VTDIPTGYQRLDGSERRPAASAKFLGPADAHEKLTVTIVLRRRVDGSPAPRPEQFAAPAGSVSQMPAAEFAARYGASPGDIQRVSAFATSHGLSVVEANAASRTVVVSGTVAQMNAAFGVTLGRYEHEVVRRRGAKSQTETYRGRDGYIHVPHDLAPIVVGVFGLDNRRITKRAAADPPNTTTISVAAVTKLYNFPTNSAAGQTIGIFSEAGYRPADVSQTFSGHPPAIVDVSVNASNDGSADGETTQDICIAAAAAPGAKIAVYFTTYDQVGWVDLLNRVIHPGVNDPVCSVLSSSFYVANGDDAATLAAEGVSTGWILAVTMVLQDAALQGITFCTVSGDYGVDTTSYGGGVSDHKAHVVYPGSDPWALCCGGTTIGNVNGASFDEYVWNDTFFGGVSGATGGGVSDYFNALPAYQSGVGVPVSLKDGHVGRGVPDVAANASPNSGYPIIVGGGTSVGNGTSAAAPLWAGLIAVLNAALGWNLGFANPTLYALGSPAFRDIVGPPGPADNGLNGVKGYPAGPAWDACTGWGSPNGSALLTMLKTLVVVPRLHGLTTVAASGVLRSAGLQLGDVEDDTDLDPPPPGYRWGPPITVQSQSPSAGQRVPRGTVVALQVHARPIKVRSPGPPVHPT